MELNTRLETEIKKAERILKETKDAANELSQAAPNSPSSSGDREHAVNAAYINQEKLIKLTKLKSEIDGALEKEVPEKVEPVCYFNSYYLVSVPMYIEGISMISPDSKLGKAVLGKKTGENYEYENEQGDKITGRIENIQ